MGIIAGIAASSGHVAPTAVTGQTIVNYPGFPAAPLNGATPQLMVNWTTEGVAAAKGGTVRTSANIYWDTTPSPVFACQLFDIVTGAITSSYVATSNLFAGRNYYAHIITSDRIYSNNNFGSAFTTNIRAATEPGVMGTITGSSPGPTLVQGDWVQVNAGGDDAANVKYFWELINSSGTTVQSSFNTNATSFSTSTGQAGTYTIKVYSANTYFSTGSRKATSNSFTVSTTPPPIFAPPPPIFVPPPPIFRPPPFFCIQGDTLIRTINGYLKARDIAVGQKLATYAFDELQYSDPEYDVWSWSANSMSNSSLQETNVIEVKKNTADKTMIFNNDMGKRFSLEHIMLVKRDGIYSFMDSKDIQINDYLVYDINDSTQDTLVESINFIDEETDIYDIIVDDYNLIIAGNILTHK